MRQPQTILDFEKSIAELDKNIASLKSAGQERGENYDEQIRKFESSRAQFVREVYAKLSTWDEVLLARHNDRPYTLDYIRMMCDDFVELHGDRHSADDGAIVGGPAKIGDVRIMIIGQQKGRDIKERVARNFGYAKPEGYRKALRLMKMAEKLGLPIVTFIDTPGADSNLGSEETAISEAIAVNLMEMSALKTPIVCIVIGEGGSGGALGLAVADRVLMLQHSIYSVIAPEGCAAILDTFGRNPDRKGDAAAALQVDAASAKRLGIIDEILPEPLGAAHGNPETAAKTVKDAILRNIAKLSPLPIPELLEKRYQKFRQMGIFDVV